MRRIAPLILSLCLFVSSCGYSEQELASAVDTGYQNGYEEGYDEGYQNGYDKGYEDGAADAVSNSDIGISGETVYITDYGDKYHREWCGSLWHSSNPISLAKAIERGYEPCQKCW